MTNLGSVLTRWAGRYEQLRRRQYARVPPTFLSCFSATECSYCIYETKTAPDWIVMDTAQSNLAGRKGRATVEAQVMGGVKLDVATI